MIGGYPFYARETQTGRFRRPSRRYNRYHYVGLKPKYRWIHSPRQLPSWKLPGLQRPTKALAPTLTGVIKSEYRRRQENKERESKARQQIKKRLGEGRQNR